MEPSISPTARLGGTFPAPPFARAPKRPRTAHLEPNDDRAPQEFITLHEKSLELERTEHHFPDLKTFVAKLSEAYSAKWSTRDIPYCRVVAFLIHWEEDDLGVQKEVQSLEEVFRDSYHFDVETWAIPSTKRGIISLMSKIGSILDEYDDEGNLFIFYYGGHACQDEQSYPTWVSKREGGSSFNSFAILQLLQSMDADALLLFDSCQAVPQAFKSTGKGVASAITATGFEPSPVGTAAEVGPDSFTHSVTQVLGMLSTPLRDSSSPVSDVLLHSLLISELKKRHVTLERRQDGSFRRDANGYHLVEPFRRRTPIYHWLSSNKLHRPIRLAPLRQHGGANNPVTPRHKRPVFDYVAPEVLISVRLTPDALNEADIDAWAKWILSLPDGVSDVTLKGQAVKIEGLYRSYSSLVILRMPVETWTCLSGYRAFGFIGYVTSANQAPEINDVLATRVLNFPRSVEAEASSLNTGINIDPSPMMLGSEVVDDPPTTEPLFESRGFYENWSSPQHRNLDPSWIGGEPVHPHSQHAAEPQHPKALGFPHRSECATSLPPTSAVSWGRPSQIVWTRLCKTDYPLRLMWLGTVLCSLYFLSARFWSIIDPVRTTTTNSLFWDAFGSWMDQDQRIDMFDIRYVAPPAKAYKTWTPFTLSKNNRTFWAISFQSGHVDLIDALFRAIITFLFSWIGGLIAAATIYLAPYILPCRRLAALMAALHSSSAWSFPWAALNFPVDRMGCHRWRSRARMPGSTLFTRSDAVFGYLLVILASILITISSVVMGFVGSHLLQLGPVAPVNPDILYFPNDTQFVDDPAAGGVYRAMRGNPVLRALGHADFSRDEIRKIVQIEPDADFSLGGAQPRYGLKYNYTITGAEFGLQSAPDLKLYVTGACRTEYSWLITNITGGFELYNLLGETTNNSFWSATRGEAITYPPQSRFSLFANTTLRNANQMAGNVSYAIAATLGNRTSTSANDKDPWYITDPRSDATAQTRDPFRIRTGRPALSCWQADTWSCCGGQERKGHMKLHELSGHGLSVPPVLLDVLARSLISPLPQRIGNGAGAAALASARSASSSVNGVLDAARSSIFTDLEPLILGSYIGTLNALTDTALYQVDVGDPDMTTKNLFRDPDSGQLLEGAGNFVVRSSDVTAFDLAGLITIGVITVLLVIIVIIQVFPATKLYPFLKNHQTLSSGGRPLSVVRNEMTGSHPEMSLFNTHRWARYKACSAVHLLRNTHEDDSGAAERVWICPEHMPEPSDEKTLRLV